MPRICATTCKAEFKLTDADLSRIDVQYARNPHYRSAAPMRLYDREEVEGLAKTIEAERPAREARREQLKLEKAEQKADAAAQAREQAVEMMAAWQPREIVDADIDAPGFALPPDVLAIVMRLVADKLEPGGVVGPTIIVRTLCNIAATCKDFRAASSEGFKRLGESAPQKLTASVDWVQLFSDPMACKADVLKQAARWLQLPVGGIKAEVAQRVLRKFRLSSYAAAAPYPNAIAAIAYERGAKAPARLAQALIRLRRLTSAAHDPLQLAVQDPYPLLHLPPPGGLPLLRNKVSMVCPTIADLEARVAAYPANSPPAPKPTPQRRVAALPAPAQPSQATKFQAVQFNACERAGCRQTAAKECGNHMCGTCCRAAGVKCARHP